MSRVIESSLKNNVVRLPVKFGGGDRLPISCFIITRNEQHRIRRCIASVIHWVDEVIVVDCSSDETAAVARDAGAKVIHRDWSGFGQQKRFAEDQCRNSWIFNLDADEMATPELEAEIKQLFRANGPDRAAYCMPVQIVYPGRDRPRLFAKDHICIRLYDRRRVRFKDSAVHDSVDPEGHPVGRLTNVVFHYTFSSFSGLIAKCDERATYSALHAKHRSPAKLRLRTMVEWPWVFIKYYLFRRHFTAGIDGMLYATIIAHYRQARLIRMLARQSKSSISEAPMSSASSTGSKRAAGGE